MVNKIFLIELESWIQRVNFLKQKTFETFMDQLVVTRRRIYDTAAEFNIM